MNIKELLVESSEKQASDLHLVANLPPAIRVDGELCFLEGYGALSPADLEKLALSMLNEKEKAEFLAERDLDLGFSAGIYRYRVNLHFEKGNVGLVARVISEDIPTLAQLEMPTVVEELLNLKQGLILLTGPTGCGKSTSLAAMVDHINNNHFYNIITLEDPIEFIFKPKRSIIMQRQLGSDIISFEAGLKHALRQDPNVILVGEMRDLETISTAITLAETGHLVMATLHTYSAAQTIDRIIDIFPSHQQNQVRLQLANVLSGIISQRLIPGRKGGRLAAREILINTPASANLIRENKISQMRTIIETGSKLGMHSLDQDIKRLYAADLISYESAAANVMDREFLGSPRG